MINSLVKYFTKKEIVLYNKHRQSIPIVNNKRNRKKYIFLNFNRILSKIPIKSEYKLKYKVAYIILNFISPKYIMDINWISRMSCLYKLWTKNHLKSKYIVIQHGSYVGGVVTDIPHRYTNCDVFLVWGNYFKILFENYNKGKKIDILNFGNPVYNEFNRDDFHYKDEHQSKIKVLLAPSAIEGEPLEQLYKLYDKLVELGFDVKIKEHSMQNKFAQITRLPKELCSPLKLLKDQHYDIIVSDHSSIILDAIFFKNPVVSFSYQETKFLEYLDNAFDQVDSIVNKENFLKYFNKKQQELLFSYMVNSKNNSNEL